MSSYVTTDGREVRTRGRKTRARLLQAGAQVFGTKGFHTARVDDIVRAAKTSHGTFYVYFPSKEALLDELLTEIGHEMADLVADLPDLRSSNGDARDGLRSWLERFGDFYDRSGAVLQSWTEIESASDSDHDTPGALNAGSDLLSALADALGPKLVMASPGAGQPKLDPGIAALALMALIERFHYYAATGQLRAEGDEVLDTLTDVVASTLVR
jgi:AcrR family transcriptional regulator